MRNILIAVLGVFILSGAIALNLVLPEVRERPAGSVERKEAAGGTEVSSQLYTLFVPKPWTVAIPKEGRMDSEGGVSDGGLAGLFYVSVEPISLDEAQAHIEDKLRRVASATSMSCARDARGLRCRPAAAKAGIDFDAVALPAGEHLVVFHGFSGKYGKDVHAMAENLKVKETP